MPKGSSAIDFAYAVHSDIGNRCIGAKVNNEPVPLHHNIANGDHVEILTARSANPTPLWLNYAVTDPQSSVMKTGGSLVNYSEVSSCPTV